jgi:hypothetical protein
MIRLLSVLAIATFAAAASAQQASVQIAPIACEKPGDHPGRLGSDLQRRNWAKNANGYLDCLKKYINDQQGVYNAILEKAKPHLDAANVTIDEYKKSVTAFKAAQDN